MYYYRVCNVKQCYSTCKKIDADTIEVRKHAAFSRSWLRIYMEERLHTSIFEESAVVERVARIVSSVRGTRPDYTRLAAELEQAISFDVFGIVLLRHDRQAVRVVICRREGENWQTSQHQLPREESM